MTCINLFVVRSKRKREQKRKEKKEIWRNLWAWEWRTNKDTVVWPVGVQYHKLWANVEMYNDAMGKVSPCAAKAWGGGGGRRREGICQVSCHSFLITVPSARALLGVNSWLPFIMWSLRSGLLPEPSRVGLGQVEEEGHSGTLLLLFLCQKVSCRAQALRPPPHYMHDATSPHYSLYPGLGLYSPSLPPSLPSRHHWCHIILTTKLCMCLLAISSSIPWWSTSCAENTWLQC